MDKLEQYRRLLRDVLNDYAHLANEPACGTRTVAVFDQADDRYLLLTYGRNDKKRVHSCWAHVELRGGKFWIHYDGTEEGIANRVLEKGVPREHIVLAFKSPEMRKYTDFAVA
jgi:hypothetical protein